MNTTPMSSNPSTHPPKPTTIITDQTAFKKKNGGGGGQGIKLGGVGKRNAWSEAKSGSSVCRRVVPVHKQHLPKVPAPGLEQLASHLMRYLVVGLDPHQVHEPLLLLEGHVLLVPLHKREQALVPEDGQGAGVGDKAYKVGEHGVDHVIREGVLLVQECPQEDAVGSAVLHLGYLEDGRARVEHGDAGLGQGAGDDEGLAEGAASAPAEGQEDALEEGGRLEEGLLEGHVQVEVEALVLGYVVADAREEDQVVEVLGLGRAQVGGEDLGGLKHGRRRPVFGLGEAQDLLPVAQGRDDLEGLGEFPRAVLGENLGYAFEYGNHFLVHVGSGGGGTLRSQRANLCLLVLYLLHDDVRQSLARGLFLAHEQLHRPVVRLGHDRAALT